MPLPGRWLMFFVLAWFTQASASFTVEEYETWRQYDGRRVRVIEFPGIHSFSRADLLAVMATEKPSWLRRYLPIGHRTIFYADDFAGDVIRIERFYSREGFPDAIVHGYVYPGDKGLRLKLEITEGRPVTLTGWNAVFVGNTGAPFDSARWSKLMPIKIGDRVAQSALQVSADTIRYKLQTLGHARAHVNADVERDTADYTARVTFRLRPGDYCYLGQTRITGLKQIGEQTVRREMTYHAGDPFDIRELDKTRQGIVRLEVFTFVSVRADTSVEGDVLPVTIRTEEGDRYRIRAGVGYHSEEGKRGQVEFRDLNFFGRGRRLTWTTSYADFHRSTEIQLFWPHTPWNLTDLTLAPKWDYLIDPGFRLETRSATTILSSRLSETVTASLSNEAGIVIRDPNSQDSATVRYTKSVETFSVGWDTRDNPLVPRRGHFLGATAAESGMFYRTDYRWWRTNYQARALIPEGTFWTLAGRAELGIMGPLYGSPATPEDERFKLGGATTVRGWSSRRPLSPRAPDGTPVGGDVAFSATAEVQRYVWGPAALALFLDAGNVWKRPSDVQPVNLYPSAGAGVLVVSPIGPVRLDYGYQLRPNPYGERRWAFHLSLGSPF